MSGISKPMVCQTYGLQPGGLYEDDGNHENDKNHKDKSDNYQQDGRVLDISVAIPADPRGEFFGANFGR